MRRLLAVFLMVLVGCSLGTIADQEQAQRAQKLCRHFATFGQGRSVEICSEIGIGSPIGSAVPFLAPPDGLGVAGAANYGQFGPHLNLQIWRRGGIHQRLLLHMGSQYNVSLSQGHREPTHNEGGLIKAMKQQMGPNVTPGMVQGALKGLIRQGQVKEVLPGIYQLVPQVPPEPDR